MSDDIDGQDIAGFQLEVLVVMAWCGIPFCPSDVVRGGDVVLFDVVAVEACSALDPFSRRVCLVLRR